MTNLEKCIAEIEFRFPCVRDHEFTSKEWQTLKAAVLAQQTNNKQSTPCHWCDGVHPMLNHAYCSNCGRKL